MTFRPEIQLSSLKANKKTWKFWPLVIWLHFWSLTTKSCDMIFSHIIKFFSIKSTVIQEYGKTIPHFYLRTLKSTIFCPFWAVSIQFLTVFVHFLDETVSETPLTILKKSFNLIHSVWNGLKWFIFGNKFSVFCQNLV